jgi:hypothetical protein
MCIILKIIGELVPLKPQSNIAVNHHRIFIIAVMVRLPYAVRISSPVVYLSSALIVARPFKTPVAYAGVDSRNNCYGLLRMREIIGW